MDFLNPSQKYKRKNNIIYDELGNQVLKFKQNTNDHDFVTGQFVENMNTYIRCYPDRVEILEVKKENVQLNLF